MTTGQIGTRLRTPDYSRLNVAIFRLCPCPLGIYGGEANAFPSQSEVGAFLLNEPLAAEVRR